MYDQQLQWVPPGLFLMDEPHRQSAREIALSHRQTPAAALLTRRHTLPPFAALTAANSCGSSNRLKEIGGGHE